MPYHTTTAGTVEVFYLTAEEAEREPQGGIFAGEGWYWWSCLPGCFPDSDPTGPFKTEVEAIADATSCN